MYRKQFLLTSKKVDLPLQRVNTIKQFYLYLGEDSEYTFVVKNSYEYHLLGTLYDWENPDYMNQEILDTISQNKSIESIIHSTNKYSGQFVFVVVIKDEIFLFNDACGQKEIFYNDSYEHFGTQPQLIGKVVSLIEHHDSAAIEYYKSNLFKKKCTFVGDTTYVANIYHLIPNHFIDVTNKLVQRFFPSQKKVEKSIDSVAKQSSIMLKGFLSAIAKRNPIKVAVTGGYDSRVLFLASLNNKCEYFVTQHLNMQNNHHDLTISQKLAQHYHKKLYVEKDNSKVLYGNNYTKSIDYPRYLDLYIPEDNSLLINGNASEIARNFFGYHKNPKARDLSILSGYSELQYPIMQYEKWLQNKSLFTSLGYYCLDMFYWEERMGNWGAKGKTEFHALGANIISPFNCRDLLVLLLCTKRKYRDSHFNRLYDAIISELTENNDYILNLPINPTFRNARYKIMKKLHIFNPYITIRLKLNKL